MNDALKSMDELSLVSPRQRRQVSTKRVHAKVEDIRERLRIMARELGAGSKLPTTRELCTSLQTSITTLTAALDLLETEQVLCRKERQGIFVSETIHQKVIHVVYNVNNDLSESPFWSLLWSRLVREIEYRSQTRNEQYRFHFVYRPFGELLPESHLSFFNSLPVDGCILVGVNGRTSEHVQLLHVPHVVFAGGGDIIIDFDIEENQRLVAHFFAKQQCKKVALFAPVLHPHDLPVERKSNVSTFKQMLERYTIPVYHELFRGISMTSSGKELTLQEQGYLLAKELFGVPREQRPDGIYIMDDMMTSGALVALEELGIRPGGELTLVSHANTGSPMLFGKTHLMTLLEIDPGDIVHTMFAELDGAMEATTAPKDVVKLIRGRIRMPVARGKHA